MNRRHVTLAAVSSLFLTFPLGAQRGGTIELGGFGRFTDFDNSLPFHNHIGVGGRAGLFLPFRLSVEGDLSSTSTGAAYGTVSHTPLHVMLLYNHPVGESSIFVGAGYAHNKYDFSQTNSSLGGTDTTDSGVATVAGIRCRVQQLLALRLEANLDFIPSPANKAPSQSFNGNLGFQAGVSLLLSFLK